MGLLDVFNDPEAGAWMGLLAAAGPRADGAGLGQRMMEGLDYGRKLQLQKQQLEDAKTERDFRAAQIQKWKDDQDLTKRQRDFFANPYQIGTATQAVPATDDQSAAEVRRLGLTQQVPTQTFDYHKGLSLGISPEQLQAASQLGRPITTKLGEGESVFDANGTRLFGNAPKPQAIPSELQMYALAVQQGYKGTIQQFLIDQKAAGAPRVAVDLKDPTAVARAGLDFQDKYRNATKDSFVRSASYNAMLEASKNPSAKGDLVMVYSLVKALDPTSAVREGEVELVNANRSIPDRIKGYAQRLASGQSLLPQEREDMLQQARALSMTDYLRSRNDIRAYRDNASRLGLDPQVYAPDPYAGVDFSPKRKLSPTAQHVGNGGWSAQQVGN